MIRRPPPHGFTMIELIIAIAITALMVVAIFSVTHSTSSLARRQKATAREQARHAAFIEIIRRDLRGWVSRKQSQSRPTRPHPLVGRLLVRFDTTTDGLAGEIAQAKQPVQSRAVSSLRYVLRRGPQGNVLSRIEDQMGSGVIETDLLRTESAIQLRFFNGHRWVNQWRSKEAPEAVRLRIGDSNHFISI